MNESLVKMPKKTLKKAVEDRPAFLRRALSVA
jgi:hypothetical protein